ncbi:unnamed protein product [Closterium sp. NIES-54]
MAPTPARNNGNSSNPTSDSDRNARNLAGESRNKRRAEDEPPALTAVDMLLGGLEVNKGSDAQQHPSALVAPVVPAAQVATAAGAAHATDAEHTPAPAAGPSRQRQRRRTAVSSSDATTAPALTQALTSDQINALLSLLQQQPVSVTATETALYAASASAKKENVKKEKGTQGARTNRHDNDTASASPPAPAADNDTDDSEDESGEAPVNNVNFNGTEHLPPLPSSNLTFSAATFVNDSVREQAELLEDLRAYLLHAEYKAQRGDPAGGLELISHALNLISGRFEVLQVEDASDFCTAKRFKLYQQKSLLTSRPFKQAVADMAAMDRAASGYARVNHSGNNAPMPFLPKRGPPPTANCRGFRGSCFVAASRATWQVPALGTGMAAKDPLRWCRSGPWH